MIQALCVDALNPAGRPNPANVKSYGLSGVRSVFFDHPDWYSYHQAAIRVRLHSIITLARESFNGRSYAEVIGNLPVDADYVVIGNEPDSPDPSSWTMTPSSFRTLLSVCAPLIRARCPSAGIVAGGLVSGQPGWLEPIVSDLQLLVDFLDIHPYSKTADEAADLLSDYYNLTHIPMMVLEWNRPTHEIKPFADMLAGETEAGAYFCWSDGMVLGFGLVDQLGRPKPQLTAMIDALGAQPPSPPLPEPPHYTLGFKEWHDADPQLLGDPLENERGGIPGYSTQRTTQGILMAQYISDPTQPPQPRWVLTYMRDTPPAFDRYVFRNGHSVPLNG